VFSRRITVFWDMTSCLSLIYYLCFGEVCCFALIISLEDGACYSPRSALYTTDGVRPNIVTRAVL
jgi:hypothetical protein